MERTITNREATELQAQVITKAHTHIPALTGVRFFAVFHIFMFHLWVLYDMEKPEKFSDLMSGYSRLPDTLITFFSHGWMSTSFFFILSGFILAYIYWDKDGNIVGGDKRFWLRRIGRLYPIHIIVMLVTFLFIGSYYLSFRSLTDLLPSAIGTLALVQSWYPPWVPEWNWPAWTISALAFLYFIMPFLCRQLAKLSRKQMFIVLLLLPIISLLPTVVYSFYFPHGSEPIQNWQIFLGSTPLFWLAQFSSGMLLSRAFGISRFSNSWRKDSGKKFAWGDIALLVLIATACFTTIKEPLKFFVRHGLLMPLFWIIILDFARGNGLAARLFSLPGTGFFGETAYSLFIWQNMAMALCWSTAASFSGTGYQQVWAAPLGLALFSVISTYWIEKPIARKLRRKFEH
ncbi:acyltransferase family protein [Teredinibacter haidensis]|uniref:acyltransferase family protein n=1 Tax=Teredinibacter haidensis TaxID=2731755 RepID=UPI000948E660|nr:acyltransferase [Teredinibacter haidensis]